MALIVPRHCFMGTLVFFFGLPLATDVDNMCPARSHKSPRRPRPWPMEGRSYVAKAPSLFSLSSSFCLGFDSGVCRRRRRFLLSFLFGGGGGSLAPSA